MGLKRQGIITDWHDRDIQAGDEWNQQIDTHLNTADVILLLISTDFLASDYCYSTELAQAVQRAVYFLLAGLVSGFVGLSLWLLGCDQDLGLNFKQAIGCRDTTRFAWKLLAGLSSMVALGGACFAVLLELSAGRFGLRR